MAISQFDRPAEMQLIDTYVPIPFQELATAGQAKQESFDRALAMEDALATQLMDTPALREIQLPGTDIRMAVDDAELVDEARRGYEDRMEGLAKSYRDKASPEYQNEMRGLVREMRQAFGNQGIFGRAKSNAAEYRRVQELISKNPDILPHRLSGIAQELAAGVRSGQVSSLQVTGTPSKGVDITDKLTGLLKNIKTTLNSKGTYSYRDNFGRIVDVKKEEITPQRVKEIAMAEMLTNPALQDELSNLSRHSQLMGREFDPMEYVDQVGNIMGATFMQEDVDLSNKFDPYQLETFKRGLEDESGTIPFSFERFIEDPNIPSEATPFLMRDAISNSTTAVENAEKQLAALKGKVAKEGPYKGRLMEIGIDGRPVDNTYKIAQAERNLVSAERSKEDLELEDNALREKAGLLDWQIEQDYSEAQIQKAKDIMEQQIRDKSSSYVTEPQLNLIINEAYNQEDWKKHLGKGESGKTYRQKSKEYDDLLEKRSQARVRAVKDNIIPGDINQKGSLMNYMNSEPIKAGLIPKTLGGNELRWHGTGKTGTKPLDEDELESIDRDKSTVYSWGFDPRVGKGGEIIVKIAAKDSDGNDLGVIETSAPKQLRPNLIRHGREHLKPDIFDMQESIEGQMLSTFGSEGNATSEGNLTVGFDEDSRFSAKIQSPIHVKSGGKWRVLMPDKSGVDVAFPFDDRSQMIQYLGTLYLNRNTTNEQGVNPL